MKYVLMIVWISMCGNQYTIKGTYDTLDACKAAKTSTVINSVPKDLSPVLNPDGSPDTTLPANRTAVECVALSAK